MKVLVQRVLEASVSVDNKIVSKIDKGLLLFIGIGKEDQIETTKWLAEKVSHLRIFSDENGKMNRSLKEVNGKALVVSQFTLYGNCLNGRRPDFIQAMGGPDAKGIYEQFLLELRKKEIPTEAGLFGEDMKIFLINDGPVTLLIEKD